MRNPKETWREFCTHSFQVGLPLLMVFLSWTNMFFFNLNKVESNSHFLYSFCCCFYPSTSHICTSRLQKYSPVFLLLFCSVFLYYFPCIFSVVFIWFYFFTLKFQISLWFTLVKDVWSKNGINLYLFSRVKEKNAQVWEKALKCCFLSRLDPVFVTELVF